MSKFHVQNELWFERVEDGCVEITFPSGEVTKLTPESWSSVVSSMCARGENNHTYYAALDFHSKEAT
jgi:hypothetical protein